MHESGRVEERQNDLLKKVFQEKGLDPFQLVQPVPDDMARENRVLRELLEWVLAYGSIPDRHWPTS